VGAAPFGLRAPSRASRDEGGFTLVELLIVVAVMPLIVGALSLGLISVFKLQSGVSNRLGNTVDSQVVQSTYQNDVSSALAVTGATGQTLDQCGPSSEYQLLGLAWDALSSQQGGGYSTIVSYAEVPNGSQWNLVRQYCTSGYSATPATTTTVAYNVEQPCAVTPVVTPCQAAATIFYNSTSANLTGVADPTAANSWVPVVDATDSTQNVTKVELALAAPSTTETGGAYLYTLAAVPAAAAPTVSTGGSPITVSSTAGCNFATPGTGYYASSMCLVDFSSLTGNNLLAAEAGCLQMEVNLPGGSQLYFCISITGVPVKPSALPTWQNAFLGNYCSSSGSNCSTGSPFYTGISGSPALYQTGGGQTVISIKNISVITAKGAQATGWWVVGADAESTDQNESIGWTSNNQILVMPNSGGSTYAYSQWVANGNSFPTDPVGNACNSGAGLTWQGGADSVTCAVPGNVSIGLKTGTAMVESQAPKNWTITLVGGGLEAMAFGVLLS
jgi:prepilin-type N-terminal cleavage/methylation domain-containing protein